MAAVEYFHGPTLYHVRNCTYNERVAGQAAWHDPDMLDSLEVPLWQLCAGGGCLWRRGCRKHLQCP